MPSTICYRSINRAEYIALISEEMQLEQLILTRVEKACREVGLKINARNTIYLQFWKLYDNLKNDKMIM